jgi:hypothetical protein
MIELWEMYVVAYLSEDSTFSLILYLAELERIQIPQVNVLYFYLKICTCYLYLYSVTDTCYLYLRYK